MAEVWRGQADLNESLAQIAGSEQIAAAMAQGRDWQMIKLEPLRGRGPKPLAGRVP